MKWISATVSKREKKRRDGTVHKYWQAEAGFTDARGKRQRLTATGSTKAKALEALEAKKRRFEDVPDARHDRRALRSYAESWHASQVADGGKAHTTLDRKWLALTHVLDRLGSTLVRDLAARRIRDCYTALVQDGIGHRTRVIAHQTLGQCLDQAVMDGLLAANPTRSVKVPGVERRPEDEEAVKNWTPGEAARILEACPTEGCYGTAVALMLHTGLRVGECLGLQWRDVDLENGALFVRRQLREWRAKLELAAEKTAQSRRRVPLSAEAVALLRKHRAEETMRWRRVYARRKKKDPTVAGRDPGEEDLLFTSRNLEWPRRKPVAAAMARLVERVGVNRITAHGCRHTFATMNLARGATVVEVAALLGDTPETVERIYAHAIIRDETETKARLSKLYAAD